MTKLKSTAGLLILFLIVALATNSGCKKEDPLTIPGNKEAVGSSAFHLLNNQQFTRLFVEVMYMEGHEPTSASMENLKEFILSVARKPNGVNVIKREISSENQQSYSLDDIQNIENQNREIFNSGSYLAISFIFLDGPYSGNTDDSQYLGVAYHNMSLAVFQETVIENSGGLTQPSRTKLESTIINHELGHIFGLVNNGTPMIEDHQDDQHGNHCDNTNCLMYYAVETTDIVDNLIGNSIPELDQNCRHDLSSNGGK